MKFVFAQLLHLIKERPNQINFMALLRFLASLLLLIAVYSTVFHYIMRYEGRSESWVTGLYWTLTVMSTLGFGDITFHSDVGKLFSIVVLLSGIVFLLILLPFTFIEFFYEPWMKAQRDSRAPKRLPSSTSEHVIIVHFDAVTKTLMRDLKQYQYPYVLLVGDLSEALSLHDQDYKVMYGDIDNPKSYELAQVDKALMVVTTASDQVNANVVATVREVSETVPIIATANKEASVDILQLAGCNHVLELGEMMGQALARRVLDGRQLAYPIGQFDELLIGEALVRHTPLVGKSLRHTRLREDVGLNVLGMWQRGHFENVSPETLVTENSVLVVSGSASQFDRYNQLIHGDVSIDGPIIIIGAGRVGRATAQALEKRHLDYRIIEKAPERIRSSTHYIEGDSAELEVLEAAGIYETPAVIITTHDDDMNIYLTIYCRKLRPDIQIISRTNLERNIATLHRAGADFVLSYASTGANAIMNLMGRDNILMIAEGLDIFEVEMPEAMIGKTIAQSHIREKTGCTVVALHHNGKVQVSLDPHQLLPADGKIILIGDPDAEDRFMELYKENES